MEKEELTLLINELTENRNAKKIRELFEITPTIDIADALDEEEDVAKLLFIIRSIGSEFSADFFSELTQDQQELIINAFTDKELLTMLENSFTDDIVDAMEEMPANMVSRILKIAPKELRKDINTLLKYEDDTAGSVMTTEYFDIKETLTVKQAIKTIREKGKDAASVYTIFIRDDTRTMVGTVNLDDLIFANEDEQISEIMDRNFVVCDVHTDQEEVANMFKRYDLNAMAVVNKENKIIGIITIDDVVDIIVEEASEDIAKLNNVTPVEDEYLKTPIYKLVIKCAPWILVLMILQIFSTLILSNFDNVLSQFIILTVFTPLIMDAGGNSGGQTTTLIVRALALDEFDKGDFKRVIWKELRTAFVIALIVATFSFCWLLFEINTGIVSTEEVLKLYPGLSTVQISLVVGGLVSSTLFVTMIISRLVGVCLPFLAKLLKRDPAVMCGPLTTTIVDIVSLLTYFVLWVFVFAPILGVHIV